jgi:hypothetical protein
VPGSDLAVFDHIVDQWRSEDGDIEPLAGVDLAFQRTDHVELDHQLVARCAFEPGTEFVHHRSHRGGA